MRTEGARVTGNAPSIEAEVAVLVILVRIPSAVRALMGALLHAILPTDASLISPSFNLTLASHRRGARRFLPSWRAISTPCFMKQPYSTQSIRRTLPLRVLFPLFLCLLLQNRELHKRRWRQPRQTPSRSSLLLCQPQCSRLSCLLQKLKPAAREEQSATRSLCLQRP